MQMVGRLIAMVSGAALLALAGPAHAGGATIASGGPSGKARAQLVQALDGLRSSALAVCWRGKVKKVKVELFVSAGGVVARSVHRSGDAVGQCAAGVLAVQRLPKAGKSYRAVVELEARASASASGGRTSAMITEDLVAYRPALQRCYDSAGTKKSGQVALKFVIQPDGRVVDPRVESAFDRKVDACMVDVLKRARLRAVSGGGAVSYVLSMALSPGGGMTAAVGGASAGAPQPKKDGPISASVLSDVMKQAMPTFQACAKKARGKLAGTAVVRFTIRADGTTRNVKIKQSDLKQPKVEACLVREAGKLQFPGEKGRAKTRVFYPFRFQ